MNTAENDIRQLLQRWEQALRDKDLDAILALYADDVVAYDLMGAPRFDNKAAYAEHWRACMAQCPDGGFLALQDIAVTAEGDLGFARFIAAGGPDEQTSIWMRGTVCYRRQDGEWKIVHEHWSVPVDMESGKARFDARP